MRPRLFIAAVSLLGSPVLSAQHVTEEPVPDPVLEAIQEFNRRDMKEANEVKVVLPPPEDPRVAKVVPEPAPAPEKPAEPVLVTGKPPEDLAVPAPEPPVEPAIAPAPERPVTEPEEGLAVRVEKLSAGKSSIDTSKVKLLAPFPAKPLARAPQGWRLDHPDNAPPISREVELAPGAKITLTIRPHLLVPDADGSNVFSVPEPGYDPSLGYRQVSTAGAVLSTSIASLDEDSKHLGDAIDRLQQLLISLPKPEPQPQPEPVTAPPSTRKR